MTNPPVGAINLEALMNRANIWFTSGYRFSGELNLEHLEASYRAVFASVDKFAHRMRFVAQNDYAWQAEPDLKRHFELIETDDLDQAFAAWCQNSLALAEGAQPCPMALAVLRERAKPQHFILAQTCEHTYVDARSAETLFNLIVDHHNALCLGDAARAAEVLEAARRLHTLSGKEAVQQLTAGGHDHAANVADFSGGYAIADVGAYAIALDQVPACLEAYRRERHAPIYQFFDLRDVVERCRAKYPELTQNAVTCAALAKGFYTLNRATRQAPETHLVSFKMLSDLLRPELRARHSGNYIAFVPVSVEGSLPLVEMAKVVHDRIRHFKDSKLDVSIFQMTEEAVDAGLVGSANDPLSFVVTNWNNYRFLNSAEYLHGCRSLRHQSGVNIDPRDTLGAVLVNRPILVINMASAHELCLSFFPSLRADAENRALLAQIAAALSAD